MKWENSTQHTLLCVYTIPIIFIMYFIKIDGQLKLGRYGTYKKKIYRMIYEMVIQFYYSLHHLSKKLNNFYYLTPS